MNSDNLLQLMPKSFSFGEGWAYQPIRQEDRVAIFASAEVDRAVVKLLEPERLLENRWVAGGPLYLLSDNPDQDAVRFLYRDEYIALPVVDADWSTFQNRKTILGEWNFEHINALLDFLDFYVKFHGVTGFLLVRREDGLDKNAYAKLNRWVRAHPDVVVGLVEFDRPLGDPTLPEARHPWNSPAAPGKDRMTGLDSDAQRSPMRTRHVFDYLAMRYLGAAAGVVMADVSDLLLPSDRNIFETIEGAEGRSVSIQCRSVYPWRVKDQNCPRFADHICRRFEQTRGINRIGFDPKHHLGYLHRAIAALTRGRYEPAQAFDMLRFVSTRHPNTAVAKLVPRSSLTEDDALIDLSTTIFDYKPVRAPQPDIREVRSGADAKTVIVTTMKNEGPFILEWIAYHRAIGVSDFMIYSNDCTDGTDTMFDLLQSHGVIQHRNNPFREVNLKPQHAALFDSTDIPIVKDADWLICMDVDEFINIHTPEGTLASLYAAIGDANLISMNWRLFGNADRHDFKDEFTIEAYNQCAFEYCPRPHQAWGFKTLYQNNGFFKKPGVHRPKGLHGQLNDQLVWLNGSGKPLPKEYYRSAWRGGVDTYGYDLVTLNHYAVRNAESYLVKRDRGRVNHVDRDQGMAYWFRMNNNSTEDKSIHSKIPMMRAELDKLLALPGVAEQHAASVAAHRKRIDELIAIPENRAVYDEICGHRMQRLSRMHRYFGANVFLSGPQVVPDDLIDKELPDDYYFTVEMRDEQNW